METCKRGHISPSRNKAGACIPCVEAYQPQYRQEYKPRKHVMERKRREKHRKRAVKYLGGRCLDCSINDYRVLVFDHLRDKEANVARFLGKRWERIVKELEKCELVCANCHLIRTNERIPKSIDTFVGRLEKKTHCFHGHPWTEENIYTDNRGLHSCLECRRIRGREYQRKCRTLKHLS